MKPGGKNVAGWAQGRKGPERSTPNSDPAMPKARFKYWLDAELGDNQTTEQYRDAPMWIVGRVHKRDQDGMIVEWEEVCSDLNREDAKEICKIMNEAQSW